MSVETPTETRGLLARLRASPFLGELSNNRLAVAGIAIIALMVAFAVYIRVSIFLKVAPDRVVDPQIVLVQDSPGAYVQGIAAYVDGVMAGIREGPAPIMDSRLGGDFDDRAPPGWTGPAAANEQLFGTDQQARDIYKRSLYGAWLALKWGTVTVGISTVAGVGLGIIAAYYGDVTDNVIMRTMDVLLAFPSLLLALALVAILPQDLGLVRAVAALTLVYTPRFARVVRGAALKVLEDEYIDATVALGAADPRVLVRHILPNTLAPITVQSTLNFGLAIIDLAALSFLGFGATAGTPSWGKMLANGVQYGLLAGKWWMSFFPGLFLAVTVLGFNLLGDGMRDALDPRMREAVD